MKSHTLSISVVVFLFSIAVSFSAVTNGNFSEGLNGWTFNELVAEDYGGAVLYPHPTDTTIPSSILSQSFDFESYSVLSFYFGVLQDYDPDDSIETDYFNARLINALDNPTFLIWDSGDGFTHLGDGVSVTGSGTEENPGFNVSLTLPSDLILTGDVTLEFELLHDYSETDPVTNIFIDDVELSSPLNPPPTVVPAPGAFGLAIIGCSLVGFINRKFNA